MEYKSYSKINLFLDITGVYKNKYHRIRSIFAETDLCDIIHYKFNDSNTIHVTDPLGLIPEDNLLKAYSSYKKAACTTLPGLEIIIEKRIPIGGGMGGGSSNACAILKILNKKTRKFSKPQLKKIAFNLGMDVPFFIDGKTQIASGCGELLKKITLTHFPLEAFAIFPNSSINTQEAYHYIDKYNLAKKQYANEKKYKQLLKGLFHASSELILNNFYNRFQEPIFNVNSKIAEVYQLAKSSDGITPLMTGSGSTIICFGKNKEIINKSIAFFNEKGYKTSKIRLRL